VKGYGKHQHGLLGSFGQLDGPRQVLGPAALVKAVEEEDEILGLGAVLGQDQVIAKDAIFLNFDVRLVV
jgi:hypothetical protein